jgi:hypothetical protein
MEMKPVKISRGLESKKTKSDDKKAAGADNIVIIKTSRMTSDLIPFASFAWLKKFFELNSLAITSFIASR